MNCPVCLIPLRVTERLGVEIDDCPKCRGVWLDRGELDKIIERSVGDTGRVGAHDGYRRDHDDHDDDDHGHDRGHEDRHHDKHDDDHGDYRHGRRKSFLQSLFD